MSVMSGLASRPSMFLRGMSLLLVLTVGAYLRFVGLNWDELEHLHPDERFLTMVEARIEPVEGGLSEYFNTEASSLNPYNHGFKFFVYGTAPIFAVRYLAEWAEQLGHYVEHWQTMSTPSLGTAYDEIHLVGRLFSGTADILTVWLIYLIGIRLYSWRVGLLASALAACTVALIQQAHFFTVDSFATMCVSAGLLFAIQALDHRRILNYALFGVAFGLALSSRINAAPLALVIVIPSAVRFLHRTDSPGARYILADVGRVVISLTLAAAVFRVAQPYAFAGPSIIELGLNEDWVRNMREIRALMGGSVDVPFNHQWTDRTALVFPWKNMVLWGMGPALGFTVWAGFAFGVWQLVRGTPGSDRHAIPIVWSGVYFLWMGTRWVHPIRYFLPIYPTLILLGSVGCIALSHNLRNQWVLAKLNRHRFKYASLLWPIVVPVVLGTTAIYALGFTRIYTRPVTRVTASRWMLDNIPGPFSVVIRTSDGLRMQPLPMPIGFQYSPETTHRQMFIASETGEVGEIVVGRLTANNPELEHQIIRLKIEGDTGQGSVLGTASLAADLSIPSGHRLSMVPPVQVIEGETYYLVSGIEGAGRVLIEGSHLISESSWDDGLPLRIDGYDPFGGIYVGHNLELYWDDDEEKLERIIAALDQGDFLVISSNRQYESIPRLPMRYPLTIAYYNALFSGELGFELIREFESRPGIGRWNISDQSAEEPFTVYDHPKVMIFRKAGDFSLERTRRLLEEVDLSSVIWMNPVEASQAPSALMLPPELLVEQQNGGTWSDMFDYSSPQNRLDGLGALGWWALLLTVGWLVFPIAYVALRGLPDKGYAVVKVLGMLVVAWPVWILSSMRLVGFGRVTLWVALGLIAIVSASVYWRHRSPIRIWIRRHRGYIVMVEVLWALLFLGFLFVRWNNPDIWHPVYGGEKPMDFAYFNAVLRSTFFPPLDPWLSGGYINYYYFGYVMVGTITKMLGIVPSIAYNLIIPMLFAMTGMGAFCVAYNLIGISEYRRTTSRESGRTVRLVAKEDRSGTMVTAGVVALILMVVLGNLGQLDTISKEINSDYADIDIGAAPLPGRLVQSATTMYRSLVRGEGTGIGTGEWYWNATRLIPHPKNESGPITEFPLFTFLYGDLHAHMISLPLTLLSMTWALGLVGGRRRPRARDESILHWMIGGMAIGSLGPTNTWDLPTYFGLGCLAIAWVEMQQSKRLEFGIVMRIILRIGLLGALTIGLYAPFSYWYGSGYSSLEIWEGSRTDLVSYLKVHGLFMFILVSFLVAETREVMRATTLQEIRRIPGHHVTTVVGMTIVTVATVIALLNMGVEIAWLVVPLVAWLSALMMWTGQTTRKRTILIIAIVGLMLTLAVELVRLGGDVGRMNTVFKFYLQVWTLLSVTSAAGFVCVWAQLSEWETRNIRLWKTCLLILVCVSGTYTVLGTAAKMVDRMAVSAPRSLDGIDYMRYAEYRDQGQTIELRHDYDAIRWLQDNAVGSPVIVEAHTSEYKYGARYSINTGLPAVIGWNWHQRQQRAVTPPSIVTNRADDVAEFYQGDDVNAAIEFLHKYRVRYVVVGEYERAYYPGSGVEKFGAMSNAGLLDIVFENVATTIYEATLE